MNWINVKDKLPPLQEEVFIYDANHDIFDFACLKSFHLIHGDRKKPLTQGEYRWEYCGGEHGYNSDTTPTHWMAIEDVPRPNNE